MKSLKKSLSLLLALVMAISCMSVGAMATGDEPTARWKYDDGSEWTEAANVKAAVDSIEANHAATVEMTADETIAVMVAINANQNITLDLNGKTITGNTPMNTISVRKDSSLTLTDSSEDGTGKIDLMAYKRGVNIVEGASFTMNGGSINASNNMSKGIVSSGAVIINGGTVNASGKDSQGVTIDRGILTIIDGTITVSGDGAWGVYNNATMEMSGGAITAEYGGKSVLGGGEIIDPGTCTAFFNYSSAKAEISGTSSIIAIKNTRDNNKGIDNAGELTITGGTFSDNPTAYVNTDKYAVTGDETSGYTVKAYVAQIGNASYDTVENAIAAVTDSAPIIVNEATTIGGETVAAGSTVAAVAGDAVNSTDSAATVTPKTLTITKVGEAAKTAKAYVVSKNEASTVVTDVKLADDSGITNDAPVVENLVNVAQVLANAVAEKNIDVSSISSMELSLKKTDNATLPTAVSEKVAENEKTVTFEVHPVATVKTTVGTTTTETTYDVSNDELAANASFTFKLTGLTANQHYTLYHYASDGTLKNTFYQTADASGEVTLTLTEFSYIVGEESEEATDFATLVARAQPGQTIVLTDDVTLDSTVVINKNLTIDLNGHTITAANCRALWVKNGDVTITGTGTVSAGTANSTFDNSSSVIRVGDSAANTNKAKLTIGENVTVSSPYCYGITAFGNNDTDNDKTTADIELVVNGTVSVSGVQAAVSGNGTNTLSATAMTINGTVTAANEYAIYHPGKGELTVNGTVSGLGGIEIKSGTLTVGENASITASATTQSHSTNNNGTSTSGYAIAAVGNSAYVGDPAVTINGGTISGTAITLAENNSVKYGSITANSNTIAVPEGYTWVSGSNGYELALVNEAFGEVYNYAGLFGNTYEMTIRFKYGDVVAANMSDYTVQLWLENGDGAGKDRLLSSSSASEYQASNVTTYKMGDVFTSGGNTFRDFTVKLFAQYLDSKIIVKLVRNSDSAVLPIATFGYRTIRTSTVATDGWGYSLKEFIDFRADYFNDASCGNNTAAATAYSNLSSAISSISSATKAASAYAN